MSSAISDWSERADDPALRLELNQVLEAALNRLNPNQKILIVLRDIEGFSTEKTARILGLSIAATKSRLHRARLYLRRELASYIEK